MFATEREDAASTDQSDPDRDQRNQHSAARFRSASSRSAVRTASRYTNVFPLPVGPEGAAVKRLIDTTQGMP